MWALYKKEIAGFFSSLTGYMVITVFLLLNSLFMWVIPGQFNVIENGYASLDGMFAIAPWVFLLLVPAVCMRALAEEKRTGTLELLRARPIGEGQIVAAKFLAAWTLVALSILPTFIHLWSVYALGSPPGNLDMGGSLGAYVGLLFLGGIYAAIGLFASSLSGNQVLAFLLAVLLCFLVYMGFEFLSGLAGSGRMAFFISRLGIDYHYASVSRGVLDSRDLLYFSGAILLFLTATRLVLRSDTLLQFLGLIALMVVLAFVAGRGFFRLDLTAEKRHTLSAATRELMEELEEPLMVKVYLYGDLPPEFLRFSHAIGEFLDACQAYAGEKLYYEFIDLYAEEDEETRNRIIAERYDQGLQVTNVQIRKKDGSSSNQMVFPGAILTYKGYELPVNLLRNNPALSHEVNLNRSIQSLEYAFALAIRSLSRKDVPRIAFVEGHGELDSLQTYGLMHGLKDFFQVDRGFINGNLEALMNYEALLVAKPERPFSEADKFALDQYLMQGGRMLFLLDPVHPFADSLSNGTTVALANPVGLEDMLFRYGVRVNYDIVADLQCSVVPVNTAPAGEQAKFSMMPWVYYPLLSGPESHPVTRGLNYVRARFASSLDTIAHKGEGQQRTVLLHGSPAGRKRQVPLYISMEEVMARPDARQYKVPDIPVGVLLEGRFESFFSNYPEPAGVRMGRFERKNSGGGGALFVLADGDIAANDVRFEGGGFQPQVLGYDPYTRQTFGNAEFLLNLVNYLCDDRGIMALRAREYRLRLLNSELGSSQQMTRKWKLINTVLPVFLLALAGMLIQIRRRRAYGRKA